MNFNQSDIENALKKSGIKSGDTVFFTTSLGTLGFFEGDKKKLCHIFLQSIKKILGKKGSIFVPTYSYSFGKKKKIFNPNLKNSKIGLFPNFIINHKESLRSIDPMLSICGIGPNKKILNNIPYTTYGKNCVFSRMLKLKKVKCCSIGLGLNWIPFLHHIDWLIKSPFRYKKLFSGTIINRNKKKKIVWEYHVRINKEETIPNCHKLGKMGENAGLIKSSNLGMGKIYTFKYKEYFKFIYKILKKNPWLSVTGPKFVIKK